MFKNTSSITKVELQTQPWFSELVSNLNETVTEGVFTSRDILIETYHKVGKMLRDTSKKHDINISVLVYGCAVEMDVSDRTLWYAVKFVDEFPDRSVLPEGKNISWNKIKTKYLTETKNEPTKKRCPHCGGEL